MNRRHTLADDTLRHRGPRGIKELFPQCLSASVCRTKKGSSSSVPRRLGVSLLVVCALCASPGAQGTPPLVDAVKRGDHAAVRALLRNKAVVNQAEADGTTALHYAVQANDQQSMQGEDGNTGNAFDLHRHKAAGVSRRFRRLADRLRTDR